GSVHWVATKILIATILLHIAGALKHAVVDRDATLRRMLPGAPALGPLPVQHASHAPLVGAGLLWAVAIMLAAVLSSGADSEAAEAAPLQQVASQWAVQSGAIDLEVVQFGNEVSGSFADWTAEITFDESILIGDVGTVRTTIATPSLALGSVTQQTMGADFFDAQNHPTAVFDAVLSHASDGYQAIGTLQIKENAMPVTLPFSLTIDGDTASMDGTITLDRRDFGIGDNMADAANLGFEVRVKVSLTATRASQ
ncbi:MAG: YceI family protein, partial [Sulfitobacter sp.]